MKTLRYLPFLFLVFLTGCLTASLDTTNKKFAAFEITYKQTLAEISSLEAGNRLKPETKLKVASALEDVNKARNSAYAAKNLGNLKDAETQLNLAILLLDKLKATTGGQL